MHPKTSLPILGVLLSACAALGLWQSAQATRHDTEVELASLQRTHAELQSHLNGLVQAETDLRSQLESLKKAPPLLTLPRQPVSELPQTANTEPSKTEAEPERVSRQIANSSKKREAHERRNQTRRFETSQRVITQIDERRQYFQQIPTEGLSEEYLISYRFLLENLDTMQQSLSAITPDTSQQDYMAHLNRASWASRNINNRMTDVREILLHDLFTTVLQQENPEPDAVVQQIREIETLTAQVSAIGGFRSE